MHGMPEKPHPSINLYITRLYNEVRDVINKKIGGCVFICTILQLCFSLQVSYLVFFLFDFVFCFATE